MPSHSIISSFVADVLLLGVPQPVIMFVCLGVAVPIVYWSENSALRETADGERRVRLIAGSCLGILTVVMALAMGFGHAMSGHEAELAASRDHLRYLPGLLLFGGLCAGMVAIVHRYSQPDGEVEHYRQPDGEERPSIDTIRHPRLGARRPDAHRKAARRARTSRKRPLR